MSASLVLHTVPRPVVLGRYGTLAGLLAAIAAGERVWDLLRPLEAEADITVWCGTKRSECVRCSASPEIV
jgi:hypothetical protein